MCDIRQAILLLLYILVLNYYKLGTCFTYNIRLSGTSVLLYLWLSAELYRPFSLFDLICTVVAIPLGVAPLRSYHWWLFQYDLSFIGRPLSCLGHNSRPLDIIKSRLLILDLCKQVLCHLGSTDWKPFFHFEYPLHSYYVAPFLNSFNIISGQVLGVL